MSSPAGPLPGGFLSPAPSSTTTSFALHSPLPRPRATPLRAGGAKESAFIRHVDAELLRIQRGFAQRDAARDVWDDAAATAGGYAGFREAAKEVERVVDVVWISGTPSLQTPYLISIALLVSTMIPGFPASPRALFRLLDKIDHAFASLLQGHDVETGEVLPGFVGRRGVSGTEKVRIRGIVERTRVCVVEVMRGDEFEAEDDGSGNEDEEDDDDADGLVLENAGEDAEMGMSELDSARGLDNGDAGAGGWDMQIAKVYDRTLVELGDSLDGPAIGITAD
ncbi:hypothetical protein LTR66_005473 [Elasticomyces elasticus]|nr:hypothetical protein LTR66_005473 [Elasticomyces elasticus]